MTDAEVAALRGELEKQERAVRDAFAQWKSAQAVDVEQFLVGEARLTAVNQADVTADVDDVPALRASLAAAAKEASRLFLVWADSLPDDKVLTLGDHLRSEFRYAFDKAAAAWIEIVLNAGYEPGSYNSGHSDWNFYVPETGTARSPYASVASAEFDAYRTAVRAHESLAYDVRVAEKATLTAKAEEAWDA